MKSYQILSFILVILGEVILITSLIYFFGDRLSSEILILNTVVCSLVFIMIFIDTLFPWINLTDRSQSQVGSIGIRWITVGLYTTLSIGAMMLSNITFEFTFITQLIIHLILLFICILGLSLRSAIASSVEQNYNEQQQMLTKMEQLRLSIKNCQATIAQNQTLPSQITDRIENLSQNIRYLSPSNNPQTVTTQNSLIKAIEQLNTILSFTHANLDKINKQLSNCEALYKERKSQY